MHAFSDPRKQYGSYAAMGLQYISLDGDTGPEEGKYLNPTTTECDQSANCSTLTATFVVPAGVYDFYSEFLQRTLDGNLKTRDGLLASVIGSRPSVDVDDNTTIDLYSDDSSFTTLKTPTASEPDTTTVLEEHWLPDGSGIGLGADCQPLTAGAVGFYLIPTPRNTIGSWHVTVDQISIQPQLTMSVSSPTRTRVALSPFYQVGAGSFGEYTSFDGGPGQPMTWFPNGTHNYPVVYVGYGTAADFAGKDLRAKLALIRFNPANDPNIVCSVAAAPLQNAIAAGAAGVIEDPTLSSDIWNDGCSVGVGGDANEPYWNMTGDGSAPGIPWVVLSAGQAQK